MKHAHEFTLDTTTCNCNVCLNDVKNCENCVILLTEVFKYYGLLSVDAMKYIRD